MAMTNKTPRVNFNLQTTPSGTGVVILTMSINGGRVRFAPGISVAPEHWDKKAKRVSNISNLGVQKRNLVNRELTRWADAAVKIYESNPEVSAKDLQALLKAAKKSGNFGDVPAEVRNTLDGFAVHYAAEKRKDAENPRDFNHLVTAANLLKAYTDERGRGGIYWADLGSNFASNFKTFLEKRGLRKNQVANVMKRTRQFIKASGSSEDAAKYHTSTVYKSASFRVKTEKPYKHYLNEDELASFLAYDFGKAKYLERVRDLFVLNAYTGLRRGDAKRVNREHYHVSANGFEQISIRTGKQGEYVKVPLLPIAKTILEKYNWELPTLSDTKYNEFLKLAAKRAGFTQPQIYSYEKGGKRVTERFEKWERLSSHDARRSFATNFYELGFSAGLIMKVTGHKEEGTFKKYICTTEEKGAELFQERYQDLEELRTQKALTQALERKTAASATVTNN
jgi:integrase